MKLYTNGIPCADCARAIIQSGIKEVIVDRRWNEDNSEKWADNAKRSKIMFEEACVKVRYVDVELLEISKFRDGREFF